MSYWAELDKDNIVVRVTRGDNNDPNGDEGYQWLIDNLGGRWIQTSFNAKIRNKFAGIGDSYNEELDAFIQPKCHKEAELDNESLQWICSNADHDLKETIDATAI